MTLKYRVIERFREKYSVSEMCRFFEVPRSSYYAWRKRQQIEDRDQKMADQIREIWNTSRQTYGCCRIWKYFREKLNIQINIKKIRRIMHKYGISSVIRRRKAYTYSNYERGDLDIPTEILIKLADLHNVSTDYILGRTDKKETNK